MTTRAELDRIRAKMYKQLGRQPPAPRPVSEVSEERAPPTERAAPSPAPSRAPRDELARLRADLLEQLATEGPPPLPEPGEDRLRLFLDEPLKDRRRSKDPTDPPFWRQHMTPECMLVKLKALAPEKHKAAVTLIEITLRDSWSFRRDPFGHGTKPRKQPAPPGR